MGIELWLAFVASAALVLMIPGPTVVTVVGLSIAHGRRTACVLAMTVAFAHATMLSLSAVGLGAVLERNPAVLLLFKVCGAVYMIYAMVSMASSLWRRHQEIDNNKIVPLSRYTQIEALKHTYFVTLLNPNTLVFFVALLPQFVSPTHSAKEQLLVMSATFVGLSAINSAVYGLSAAATATRARTFKIGVPASKV